MLIVALVLAVIGLAALITAVVTGNEIVAWACIGASGLGILVLIADAIRERSRMLPAAVAAEHSAVQTTEVIEPAGRIEVIAPAETTEVIEPTDVLDVADDETRYETDVFTEASAIAEEDHPDELVHEEPDYDLPSDDEAEFPEPAEEAAIHVVAEESVEDDSGTDLIIIDGAVEQYDESDAAGVPAAEAAEPYIVDTTVVDTTVVDTTVVDTTVVDTTVIDIGDEESVVDVEGAAPEIVAAPEILAAPEIRYVPSAEGSADTVYTYSESSEYIEVQDPEAAAERRDQDPGA